MIPPETMSKIYSGHVEHARQNPVDHRFKTPVTFFAFRLDELEDLDTSVRGFGFNQWAPLSLRESDYLTADDRSIMEKLTPWIEKCGLTTLPDHITLVTSARWFGYVFNPVSFYLLEYGGEVQGMIAEVNNTFGDRHMYAVPMQKADGILQQRHEKEFHVSPFNNMDGEYQFTLRNEGDDLYIGVDLYRDGEKILDAWIEGTGETLTTQSLRHISLRHPLRPWLTMPRIVWQAILLKFRKKLPAFTRPEPDHSHTILTRNVPR
jgi:DUF1365 family protein